MCPGYGDYSERHSDIREILTDKCRRAAREYLCFFLKKIPQFFNNPSGGFLILHYNITI